MGEAELKAPQQILLIHAHIISYGDAADATITEQIRNEIETMWNSPKATIVINHSPLTVQFKITGEYKPELSELEVYQNTNPRNNYFRIEEYVHGNISFVDGVGSNTGYFKVENLYKGSTTAAHEFGHTLGLEHPRIMDVRGHGRPGIMYPRGTLVDPQFQYDPLIQAGFTGGTMHPMHRTVQPQDIEKLKLHTLYFKNGFATVGAFTNVYHWNHATHIFIT